MVPRPERMVRRSEGDGAARPSGSVRRPSGWSRAPSGWSGDDVPPVGLVHAPVAWESRDRRVERTTAVDLRGSHDAPGSGRCCAWHARARQLRCPARQIRACHTTRDAHRPQGRVRHVHRARTCSTNPLQRLNKDIPVLEKDRRDGLRRRLPRWAAVRTFVMACSSTSCDSTRGGADPPCKVSRIRSDPAEAGSPLTVPADPERTLGLLPRRKGIYDAGFTGYPNPTYP